MKNVTAFQLGVKIYCSLLGASIIGTILSFISFGLMDNHLYCFILQSLNFFILGSMAYSAAWKDGFTEMNRVKCGYVKFNPWKGFIAGLYAIMPAIVLWGLFFLSKALDWVPYQLIYRILNGQSLFFINHFVDPNLEWSFSTWGQVFCTGFYWLLVPVLTGAAFHIGYRRFSIMELIFYKKKN